MTKKLKNNTPYHKAFCLRLERLVEEVIETSGEENEKCKNLLTRAQEHCDFFIEYSIYIPPEFLEIILNHFQKLEKKISECKKNGCLKEVLQCLSTEMIPELHSRISQVHFGSMRNRNKK